MQTNLISDLNYKILINTTCASTVSYAAVQNNVPIIQTIRIENVSNEALKDVGVLISANPSFMQGQKLHFDCLQAGEVRLIDVNNLNLMPNHEYLVSLNEAEHGHVNVGVLIEGEKVGQYTTPVDILAHNEWGGTRGLPELLAAFVQPNSLVIDRVLGSASKLLSEKNVSLDGYQSKNRERVWMQVNAISLVLRQCELQYSSPPASFESAGQKIRTSERILDAKVSTCLDSAVLLAACFEQAGLNPVLALKEGHAWVGVWLVDTCFATAIVDSAQDVRKRVDTGELLMIEATAITQNGLFSLKAAVVAAHAYLEESTTTFNYLVDIKRARLTHIRALKNSEPSPIAVENSVDAPYASGEFEPAPDLPTLAPESLPQTEVPIIETPQGRLLRWKGKLLDLTLRNKLLNFKSGKTFLKIISSDPHLIEDALATDGHEFKLLACPQLMDGRDPRSAQAYISETGMTPAQSYAQSVLKNSELVFDVPEKEFDARLVDVFRTAKNVIEETGANTLYVSLGMLHWKESPDSETVLKAPILLIPVALERKAVGSGIRLKRHDDETIFNPTLLQRLANDFEISLPFTDGQLPADDKGIDVAAVLQKVRIAVAELKGFEVLPDCYLGNFSFTKYVMWKDLNSRVDELSKSAIVNHLINHQKESFFDGIQTIDAKELDELYAPQSLFTPLISDSSQLAVVCTAAQGKNIVVEGPPGTGKSQTITNMIAHFLAMGKTVLFVAEKMAALDVVHKRLSALGLAEFCLELHSSKAKKAEVAKDIVQTLNVAHQNTSLNWEQEAEKLASARNNLTDLVKVLHRKRRNGLNVYDAMGMSIAYKDQVVADFTWQDAEMHDEQDLAKLKHLVGEMSALAGQLSNVSQHPLTLVSQIKWSPSWQDNVLERCKTLNVTIDKLKDALSGFAKVAPLTIETLSLNDLAALDKLASTLMQAADVPSQSVAHAHQVSARQQLQALLEHGEARNEAWLHFDGKYTAEVNQLNAKELRAQWQAVNQKWWLKKWLGKREWMMRLKPHQLSLQKLEDSQVDAFLQCLIQLNVEDEYLQTNSNAAKEILGTTFKGHHSDWVLVNGHLQWMEAYSQSLNDAHQSRMDDLVNTRAHLKNLLHEQADMFASGSIYFKLADALRNFYREFSNEWCELQALVSPNKENYSPIASGVLTELQSMLADWASAKNQFQPWCIWQQNKSKAYEYGLQGVLKSVELGEVELKELAAFFDYSYQHWWVKKIFDKEPLLSEFSGATHEYRIKEFQKLDEQFHQLTQRYIVAKLRGHVPNESERNGVLSQEIKFLKRQAQLKTRHKPIRTLMTQTENILTRVKPCLLMSPLSVAQYLDAGHAQFDVVIFDEASQIPTWDAVGAIARGKQFICVGDPKQLPPTSFFSSGDIDNLNDEEQIQEMESVLDECLSIGMSINTLDWHYRSKNESLITFSNRQYYDNRLITFPSPNTLDDSVKFVWVDGIYDAGKSRTNQKEAEAVVAAIVEHYVSGKGATLSIGVITFNVAQRDLIENLLDAARVAEPKLDVAIAESTVEPYFVKNLENVQGDERDIILFSITFGKDIGGKLSMNFGPMNKDGGWRRLNVAASRARHEVRLFSSLRPEHIDLNRTKAQGVKDLKAYLDFALNGVRSLATQATPTGREPDSPFEAAVIQALRQHGWEVHPQVGVSGYRIDIGVVNPHEKGRYLLGVECDGATYHSASTARDRDRLRQKVLEDLGWNMHRIWSTDWWINPEIPMKKLLERLSQLETLVTGKK